MESCTLENGAVTHFQEPHTYLLSAIKQTLGETSWLEKLKAGGVTIEIGIADHSWGNSAGVEAVAVENARLKKVASGTAK